MDAADIIFNHIQEIFIAEEEYQQERRMQFLQLARDRKYLRDVSNPFTLDAEYFRKYYRFTPEVAVILLHQIEFRIIADHACAVPPHLQLLITLRFLAEGAFQKGFGQDWNHPISQSTASRCVARVVDAINALSPEFIAFPSTAAHRQRIQNEFQRTIRIPNIIGLVDCFVVRFRRPSENEEAFFNYRHATSMNVQIIVDSNYIIRNVRICPGSNNDRFIWQFSQAREYLESLRQNPNIVQEEGNYYILGDSGYTLSPVLLTPILGARPGTPEAVFTAEHVRTRCRVEQTIGVLTNVWMAINRARKLYYSEIKVAKIINACVILHNLRKLHGMEDVHVLAVDNLNNLDHRRNANVRNGDYAAGIAERARIVRTYYT